MKNRRYLKIACFMLVVWAQGVARLWPVPGAETLPEATRLLYRGEFSAAAAEARQYLKTHPVDAGTRVILARALLAQGNYLGAYAELSRVVRADPTNVDGLYYLGKASILLSRLEYQELARVAPDSYRVHQLLAESYVAQQNKTKAEEEYQAALKTTPSSTELLDALADLKREAYQFAEGAALYQRAVKIAPEDYTALYGLGACALFQQDVPKAIGYLRRATAVDPQSAAARLALGDALLRDNQAAAAVDELKIAVYIQPNMRQGYSLLARAYGKLGQPQLAQEALARERELSKSHEEGLERNLDTQKGLILVAPDAAPKPLPENHP